MKDFIAAKDWQGLEGWAKSELLTSPKDARYHSALGISMANQERPIEAVEAFRRATELHPGKTEGWYNLCLAGAQVPDRTAVTDGLDGVALKSSQATKRLLDRSDVRKVLGSDEPADIVDFSRVRIKIQPPPPPYPPEAKALRIQGTVIVEMTQDRDGRVIKTSAVEGPEELRNYAAAWAACWRFHPIPTKQKADRQQFRLTMPFRLR